MADEARRTLAGIAAAPEPPDGERGWLDLIADNPPSELVAALRRVKSDLAAKAVPIEPSKDEAAARLAAVRAEIAARGLRSEEHTSELQSH